MRILTFLHSFEPGGVERVALRLVRQWRAMGLDAPLFIGRREGVLQAELANDLVFTSPTSAVSTGWFETLWMIWKLPAVIRKVQPDVLFCAGNTYSVVAVFMKLMLGTRCPPIVTKLSNDLVRPGLPPRIAWLFRGWAWLQSRFIDRWVVMHPTMSEDVCLFADAADVSVIPDPALTTEQVEQLRTWHPPVTPRQGRRFVAIGRLVPQKNYPLMLRSFATAASSQDRLTIFGDGPRRASLQRLATRIGAIDRVHFAGHVHDPWFRLMEEDALLLSSAYEGIPAVLLEAMTCGMPIAATDCGAGVRGLVDGYPNATISRVDDPEAFSAAIRDLSAREPCKAANKFDAEVYTIEAGALSYVEAFAAAIRKASYKLTLARKAGTTDLLGGGPQRRSDVVLPQSGRE